MHVTLVQVHVRPEHVEAFVAATEANHRASIREPGNLRFDVLQSPEDATRFLLYEAYTDAAAARAHKDTPHYQQWRATVADWMAEPRQGTPWQGLLPHPGGEA